MFIKIVFLSVNFGKNVIGLVLVIMKINNYKILFLKGFDIDWEEVILG